MSIAICLLMITSISASITQNVGKSSSTSVGTIYVDDDNTSGIEDGTIAHPYNTIQEGVDAASSGDTVYVFSGMYNENAVINTSIELIGEDKQTTIVDGNQLGDVIQINVDSVLVSGFFIMNSGTYVGGNAGIRLNNVTNCKIQNNKCLYNLVGIFLYLGSENELLYNDCLFNNHTGISSHGSKSNRIKGNNCSYNLNHGIHIDFYTFIYLSEFNIIENNICSYNKEFMGIWVRASPFNIIKNNTFSNNIWGLDLVDSDGTLIKNNTIYNNSWYNLCLYRSDNNTIENNNCLNGQHGIYLAQSKNNHIFHNNIINNSNQAVDGNPLDNHWYHSMLLEGNYWSDYTGVDDGSGIGKHAIAGDGIGDTLLSHPAPDFDFYPFVRKDGWTETVIQPPIANAGPDQTVNEGSPIQFDGSTSYDPDGTIVTFEWDFDASDGLWWETGASPDALGSTASHVYGDDGVFIVTLRVTDESGASDTDISIVTVINLIPTIGSITAKDAIKITEGVTEEWVTRYNGPGDALDEALAITTDFFGNVYVTGSSQNNSMDSDCTTIKYDPDGKELWVAKYKGPGNYNDRGNAIAIDPSGNVFVTGASVGIGTSVDYITIKYDKDGNQLWVARYNGPNNGADIANTITIDLLGNIYISGRSQGVGTFEDYATVAYDTSGNELWVARYNGPGNGDDEVTDIVTDSLANVYVTGVSWGLNLESQDYATIKYNKDGNLIWLARYNGSSNGDDGAWGIAIDESSDNLYVTGYSENSSNVYATSCDYATLAYDLSGNELWVARYNGLANNNDIAKAIGMDQFGNIYVTGASRNIRGDFDFVTVAYDPLGNQLWAARYDGPANNLDMAWAMALNESSGNVYITGRSNGGTTGYDYATIAYDLSGNELWTARYNFQGNGEDRPWAIATDSQGNVFVTGWSAGPGTGQDYATIKYSPLIHYECNEGSPVTFTASAIDPGSDDLIFTWDWGDGISDTVTTYYNNGVGPEPVYDPATNEVKSPLGTYPFSVTDTVIHTYGDDGIYFVTITIEDDDGGARTYTMKVTVQNVDPTVTIESITMEVEIGLRVAGRKYNNVSMRLYEDGNQIGYVSIERMPGSPDEQMAWIPVSINFSKSYNATVIYTPEDPPNIGGNPVWIYIRSKDGSMNKIHHTFNVQQSKKRDSEHWNHVEPWEVDLNGHFIGLPFEITSHIIDPGSDDETLTFTYGSQVKTVTYLNNPPNTDPYPSPEVSPVDIMDTTILIYEGPGTLMLNVEDDDGGFGVMTLGIS